MIKQSQGIGYHTQGAKGGAPDGVKNEFRGVPGARGDSACYRYSKDPSDGSWLPLASMITCATQTADDTYVEIDAYVGI